MVHIKVKGEEMKKINSIGYGGEVIGSGIMMAFILPGIIHILPFQNQLIKKGIAISLLIIGLSILVGIIVLLIIEGYQDKYLDHYYEQNRNIKCALTNGKYECMACGNRNLSLQDRSCPICGIYFMKEDHENGASQ